MNFFSKVLLVFFLVSGISAYPLLKFGNTEIYIAVGIGAIVSLINVLVGYTLLQRSFQKNSYQNFLQTFFGSMVVRLGCIVVILLLCIKVFNIHTIGLASSLLGFYIIFMFIEVFSIQKMLR